jgi:DNA-binding FadR family transcriptional regulator
MKSYILERGLKAGDPLPNEQELMAQLGVGRHPLREAMKALQAVGIIEIRHGYGTYVGEVSLQSLEDGLAFRMTQSMAGDLKDVRDVLDVREALEVGMADRVIEHYRGEGLEQLGEIVETMEEMAERGETFAEQDLAFHRTLYQPLDNQLIIDLLSVFWRTFAEVNDRLPGDHYTPADAARWHRNLLEAIRRDSAGDFTHAMKDHFTGIRVRFDASGN